MNGSNVEVVLSILEGVLFASNAENVEEDGLWSMLSMAAKVKRSSRNEGGKTIFSSKHFYQS